MPTAAKPTQIILRAYQVGFGDCFLLTFKYSSNIIGDRHVLIDFGSSEAPTNLKSGLLLRVAEDIVKRCSGKLHIVVASHRHSDHISGFATKSNGKGTGDLIRKCNPDLVMQPWTEDPDIAVDAKRPLKELTNKKAFVRQLSEMHSFSQAISLDAFLREGTRSKTKGIISFLGETNVSNKPAVINLMNMSSKSLYLYHGASVNISNILPGVKIHVLGPPTLEQSNTIKKQRTKDEAEFWHLQAAARINTGIGLHSARLSGRTLKTIPPYARWIIPRLHKVWGEQILGLVRILDKVMNNTSLILVFEVGNKKLLFPGDAQIENWSYTLDKLKKDSSIKKLLNNIDLLKVGHHGSLNATPKTLWNGFSKKGTKKQLITILSTMPNKHGSESDGTEVPRKKLVEALKKESTHYSTTELKSKKDLCKEIVVNL